MISSKSNRKTSYRLTATINTYTDMNFSFVLGIPGVDQTAFFEGDLDIREE